MEWGIVNAHIARMANPWTLATKPTRITTPTKSWEIPGFKVTAVKLRAIEAA